MVIVHTTPGCGACAATKVWLRRHGIPFIEIDASAEAENLRGLGFTQLPVVMADGAVWSGFQEKRLLAINKDVIMDR
jgi:glutaredoxin-like protein NrdH